MVKKIAAGIGLAAVARAGYLFFTGQDVTVESMLFLAPTPKGPQPIGEGLSLSSFIPYAPGANKPGPFAPSTNQPTNQGSDVTIPVGSD